jgi:hypothetical protein
LLAAGMQIPDFMIEHNNKRKKDIEHYYKYIEQHTKSIIDYKRFIVNKRNHFQVYYFKKGFKINKLLVPDDRKAFFAIVSLYVTREFPVAVFFYWTTNNLWNVFQV